jgi:hypothetical protein
VKTRTPTKFIAAAFVAVLLLSGCQPPKPAALSDDQVLQVVDNILSAINTGDFDSFSRDLSDEMKQAFGREQFTSLATLIGNASGKYVLCPEEAPDLTNNQGYAVYRLTCTYELEKVVVTLTFKEDGAKVEGLFFDSPNLRDVSQ